MSNQQAQQRIMQRFTVENMAALNNEPYLQLPMFLFHHTFKALSNSTRLIYMHLYDRHRLSVKNNWRDMDGEVYIYFSRKELQEAVHSSPNTVLKGMKDLQAHGLIRERPQGMGMANRIYVLLPPDHEQMAKEVRALHNNYEYE